MSAARGLLLLIFGFTMLRFICCYSDGSTLTDQCQSMDIQHSPSPGAGPDLNIFTVDPDNVIVDSSKVGTGFTVTLSTSSGSFMGYMLEARTCDNCPPAGTFSGLDSEKSVLLCSGQAVAQPDNSDKNSVQVTWTPQDTGQFYFRAAFVQNYGSFSPKKAIILPTTTTSPPSTTPTRTSPLTTRATTTTPTTTTPQTTQTTMQTTMQTTTQTTTTTPTPTTLQTMMTTATTTSTDTTTTVTTRRTTLDTSTAPPTSAVKSTQTGLTVFTTPTSQATVNTTQTDQTTNTTVITSNTQSQTTVNTTQAGPTTNTTVITTTVTPLYLSQCVQYMRGGLVLLLFSRLCFLGGSSLLMIIKPVSKMPTQITSIIELISKIIATILVLIKAAHYDCGNAGLQTVFAALIVTAMVTSLMHTITVFLHRGPSHELRKCWIASLIIVDLLNTLITSISIFYGLWWFQGRWLLIVMAVFVILEFILYLGAVVSERIEKHKTRKRVEQNHPVLENRKSPWLFMFVFCLVIFVMFTVALIVGVSLLCFQAGSSCMLLN